MTEHKVSLDFTFKNIEASDPLKDHANEKIIACLRKYIHRDVEAHMIFDVEKKRQIAEITLHCYGKDFIAKEESDNMYKSIDALVENIGTQLRRQKRKATSHH